jgi:hypothetical protein
MNKRTFIKLFAAAMAIPAVSRLLAWAGGEQLKNWAGNLDYSTDRLYAATSLEQVQDYTKKESKLKGKRSSNPPSQAVEPVLKCGYGLSDERSPGKTTDPGRDSADCVGICN